MSSTILKFARPLIRPLLPYLPLLPKPVLTLPPSLFLHYASQPQFSVLAYLRDPFTNPLHAPLVLTLLLVPLIYTLGHISGNVSWVDRAWPFYTPVHSALIVLWAGLNEGSGVYGHNLPRLGIMMVLQIIWSTRLLSHAIRRDFYDLTSEDYRYTQFRKIVPRWLFSFVHLFVIAIAQPFLLFSLSLPLHSVLVQPPAELSPGPISTLSVPYSAFLRFLPARYHIAPASTPVLNVVDFFLLLLGLAFVFIEYKADNAMFAFQSTKHSKMSSSEIIHPPRSSTISNAPQPTPYPRSHHPGFLVNGLFRWSRHPNFAAEQLFWVDQALFVVAAGESSGVTRKGWVSGGVFGPCFALSLLFCSSTNLTEWITGRKFPTYWSYRGLVGQFLPQETALIWLWGTLTRSRAKQQKEVYGPLTSVASEE